MPHSQLMYGLIKLHSRLEGRLSLESANAEKLAHVRAVIEIVSPDFDISSIRPKKPYAVNPWFKRGEIILAALDALRAAEKPLTQAEMATAMLAKRGVLQPTQAQLRIVRNSTKITLLKYEGKVLTRHGNRRPIRWSIQVFR